MSKITTSQGARPLRAADGGGVSGNDDLKVLTAVSQ